MSKIKNYIYAHKSKVEKLKKNLVIKILVVLWVVTAFAYVKVDAYYKIDTLQYQNQSLEKQLSSERATNGGYEDLYDGSQYELRKLFEEHQNCK